MPLAVRYVEPKNVYRNQLPSDVKNELQGVVALTLAGTIRQISSLARQAESILGELCDTLTDYHQRTEALEKRVEHLRADVLPNISAEDDKLKLTMLPLPASHFHSDQPKDQCLLNSHTGPTALLHQYKTAMDKPALHVFTPLWEDGRNALYLYSNPEFFFDHWRTNMEKKATPWHHSSNLESSSETPQIVRAAPAGRLHYVKKGISHSATLPSRVKSRKEGKASVKDLFDTMKDPAQKGQQGVSEETVAATGQEPRDSSSYLSQYSSSTSLLDQESGYGSSGNQEVLQRYPSSQPLQSNHQVNGRENTNKLRVLTRNRSSSVITIENKWRQRSKTISSSDMPLDSNFPKAYMSGEGLGESRVKTGSVTQAPRRKAPPAPSTLTSSPSSRSPLYSPQASRKQSTPSISDLVPNGSPILSKNKQEHIPTGSKVSPEIKRKGELITRHMSFVENDRETAFPFGRTNTVPITSPKLGNRWSLQDNRMPFSPGNPYVGKGWGVPIYPTSPGAKFALVSQNHNKQQEKADIKLSLASPPHSRPRLGSQEGAVPSSSTQRRPRAWSRSSSDEDTLKRTSYSNKLLQQPLSKSKTNPKTTSKKKEDHSESRGRSGSASHKSKTANQILKQSGVNAVINSQHNNLLLSIRQGIQLRKVQQQQQQSNHGSMPWDVAAILERRHIMELSDNEHEDGAVDENEWEEN